MKVTESMAGEVTLELTSADLSGVLTVVSDKGITLNHVEYISELTVRLTVNRQDFKRLKRLLDRRGEDYRVLGRMGIYWGFKHLLKRPVLIVGLTMLILLALILPSRVLFITVEGNAQIPAKLIIEQAQSYGIYFGAERRALRSEKIKNGLLGSIPELQWVGVTTEGCVAKIHVRERSLPEEPEQKYTVGSMIASRDGVIKSCTVNRGTSQCTVGQAVTQGQVLISGYTDCGLSIRADRAEGEVFAQTNRVLSAVTPSEYLHRGSVTASEKKFSMIIGKKRINFYKDSGILDATCVKMYTENYMTLPGAFQLPVILVTEQWIYYDLTERESQNCQTVLLDFAERYLTSQMVAGQILQRQETIDGSRLEGEYACLEMIGQVRYEESIPKNEDR